MKRKALFLSFLLIAATLLASCNKSELNANLSESISVSESESESESADIVSDLSESEETSSSDISVTSEEEPVGSESVAAKDSDENVNSSEETKTPEIDVKPYSGVFYIEKSVNVRSGPSTDFDKISTLNKDDKIIATGLADNGWVRFDLNGQDAFVSNAFVLSESEFLEIKKSEQEAIEQALLEEQEAANKAAQEAANAQAVASTGDSKQDVIAIINQERAVNGLGAVAYDASLDAVAQVRAQEIFTSFSHTRPDGRSCFSSLDDSGIVYSAAGENIAAGYSSAAEVMQGWMNSAGHRANILNGSFGKVGIGLFVVPGDAYSYYWVQIFTN